MDSRRFLPTGHTPQVSDLTRWRERIALWIAPSLYVPYREDREEAFRDLAEIAYLSRDAIWTSPRTLVRTALAEAARRGVPS